jgi:hypothetical protein
MKAIRFVGIEQPTQIADVPAPRPGFGGDGESRALRFFERLWQYDQIVFDASRAAANRE